MTQQIDNGANLFDKTIAISINVEGMGGSRKVSLDNVTVDADKDRLRLASKILQCPEKSAIDGVFARLRATFSDPERGVALPALLKRGTYLIPKKSVIATDATLRAFVSELTEKVQALKSVYFQRIAEDKTKLREKFSEKHYPSLSALDETFRINWRYWSIGPSAELESISADVYQQEVSRVRSEVALLGEEIKSTLRQSAFELVAHMHDRLGMDEAGKPKVFRASAVENLIKFIDQFFDAKNVMEDDELGASLRQMRELLTGVDVSELRTDEALRNAMREKTGQIASSLETLIVSRGRQITLPDEPASAPEPEPPAPVVAAETCKKHRGAVKPCQKCKAEAAARRSKAAA